MCFTGEWCAVALFPAAVSGNCENKMPAGSVWDSFNASCLPVQIALGIQKAFLLNRALSRFAN